MSDKLPILKSEEILRMLFKLGFQPKRKKGSHLILSKGKELVIVPIHKGRDIPKGTLKKIIKQTGLNKKEFLKILRK